MPLNMVLWSVSDGKLEEVAATALNQEQRLEEWISRDPSILGMDLLLIGRQVATAHGGRMDLLGMDVDGDLVIIELKRHRTPREIIAQILYYASSVCGLAAHRIESMPSAQATADFLRAQFDVEH